MRSIEATTLTDFFLLDDAETLSNACREIRKSPTIGVDTETNGLHAYRSRVCIVQFTDGTRTWLVDAIAFRKNLPGFQPVLDLLKDESIEKILHGSSHDVASMKEDYGSGIGNIFDTHVAAQILGYERNGLSSLVERHFGKILSKKLQKMDWAQRPLDHDALSYLCEDVAHLLPLNDLVLKELAAVDLVEEARLESRKMEDTPPMQAQFDPDGFWRMRGIENLPPEGIAFLSRLYTLRDQFAEKLDRPPFKTIPDQVLIACAAAKHRGELDRIDFLRKPHGQRFRRAILEAFAASRHDPIPDRPPRRPPVRNAQRSHVSRSVRDRLDEALRLWRQEKVKATGRTPLAILPNHVLESIVFAAPTDLGALATINWLGRHRLDLYGPEIIEVVARSSKP